MSPRLIRELRLSGFCLLGTLALIAVLLAFASCATHHRAVSIPAPAEVPEVVLSSGTPITFQATPGPGSTGKPTPVYFDFDRYAIRPDQRPGLVASAEALAPVMLVTLEGHCDERGTDAYNLALGLRRAYAVRNYLRSVGVLSEFRCLTLGEERPADPGHDEAAWARNRRVELR